MTDQTFGTAMHVQRVLDRFQGVRPSQDGWVALCPCPDHNLDGDQNASLRITLGQDGRVLLVCRVGCRTEAVLDAVGLDWVDLFAGDGSSDEPPLVPVMTVEEPPRVEEADPGFNHQAYQTLLNALTLGDVHRADLRRRGLRDDEIDRRGYRSLRNVDRGRAARTVHQHLDDAVLNVPGFIRGEFGVTLHGDATGIVVPVRDATGSITALKIRREGEPKYVYLSNGADGAGPSNRVHVPLGITAPSPTVRVTEGELKADVCVALDGMPTIGVPGVTQWKPALPVLTTLGTKTVVLAFDADLHTKPNVLDQVELFYNELIGSGFEVEVEDWHDQA